MIGNGDQNTANKHASPHAGGSQLLGPHHKNAKNNNTSDNTHAPIPMSEKKKILKQGWIDKQAIRDIEIKNHKNDLAALHKRYEELETTNIRLKEEKELAEIKSAETSKKARELQAEYYDRTKNIRVTDDDFSTIIAKLGKFSGKLSNFPPNSKSCFKKNLERDQVIERFMKLHKKDELEIKKLFDESPGKADYALVSVLIEKFIMREIVEVIFRAEIHLDSKINDAYKKIRQLFSDTKHEAWINELRLKTAKATFDSMHSPGYDKTRDNETRKGLIMKIMVGLNEFYDKPEDIEARVEKLVDMAIDLSLPIRGQEDLVEIIHLEKGDDVHTNQVKPLYKMSDSVDKIRLGVSPVFLAKSTSDDAEEIETYKKNYTLVYPGKAIY
ncbi:uncharacterized protein EV154DRAFT_498552 [Mucor mucedo]|uniref:uncharacterized protein n=1 Tax=Mucor mucedo TaxID=29922 RepID=UPI00221EBEA8|nr:uncharacterized protein EV154DRAFT_498552 [Mucor mucedo]KAI7894372.1 hypothetical protein EV154DRAFT_498552 [Mucor mucedo]